MKRFKQLSVVVVSVACFLGFIGLNCLTPANVGAAEQKADAKAEKKADAKKAPAKKAKAAVSKKKEPAAVVVVAPPVAALGKKVSVVLAGSGFEPEKEIRVLFTDAEGMQTDIGYALDPEPKANKAGAFSTTWKCDEFIKAKLISVGAFTLTVTDGQFNPLAQTPISFIAEKKKDDGGKDKGDGKDKGEKKDKGDKEKKKE